MKMEVRFQTEGAAIAKAQICVCKSLHSPSWAIATRFLPVSPLLYDGKICSYGTGLEERLIPCAAVVLIQDIASCFRFVFQGCNLFSSETNLGDLTDLIIAYGWVSFS